MPSVCQTGQSSDYTPWQNQEKLANNFSQLQPLVPQHQIHASATLHNTIKSEPDEISKEYLQEFAELELSHRKLVKENKELQVKHSKVCSEIKAFKDEKENLLKEKNSFSVALKSSKKDFESHVRDSGKAKEALMAEITNLREYKTQQEQELRKTRKLEKKHRQKEKKKASKTEVKDLGEAATEHSEEKLFAKQEIEVDEKEPDIKNEAADELHDETKLELSELEMSELEIKKQQGFVFKSENPRFASFPDKFDDWSEDQIKLYLQKYLKRTIR